MLEQQRQDAINVAILEVFSVFRGTCDTEDTAEFALAMAVLKFVSDRGVEPFGEVSMHAGERRYFVPKHANFCVLFEARWHLDLGDRINRVLREIEYANSELVGMFRNIDFNVPGLGGVDQKERALCKLMEVFSSPALNFRVDQDGAQEAASFTCDAILTHAAEVGGKRSGENFTPSELSQLIARLMQPKEGESVCDPCSGLASTLLASSQQAYLHSGGGRCTLFGQEVNGRTWGLARMNMLLHGETDYQLEWGDTLRNPKLLDGLGDLRRFDVVVSNPPFSMREWGYEEAENDPYQRYLRGVPPRALADFAFISHMVKTLKPEGGRMAVIVSLGVLFRGGAERQIREQLIKENLIDAVIALPTKMLVHTSIPTAILVLRNNKKVDDILFIDASRSYKHGRTRNVLSQEDLSLIETTYQTRNSRAQFSKLVQQADIASNDYNLSVARYVEVIKEEETVDLSRLRTKRAELKSELALLEEKLATLLKEIGHG